MFPMLKWWFLENGVWKIHIHIRKIQVIEVFFFRKSVVMLAVIFLALPFLV